MDFRAFSLSWLPLFAVAGLASVSVADAQSPATNGWKPIVFSSPDNKEISSNLTSLSTQPVPPSNFRGLFEDTSPVPSFKDFGPVPPMPEMGRRLQKSSQDSQDWVFMTPEEIMGVAPEQRAPSQKRDAGSQSDDNNLSPMDRYLERQYPSETMRNNLSGDSSRSQNFFGSDNDQTNGGGSAFSDVVNNGLDDQRSVTTLSPSANNAPDHNAAEGPNTESVWSKLLGTPALQPNPNDAQQPVGVDQFQQLLNPSPATPMVSTPLPNPATSFNAQNNLSDSDSTQPLANPVGASFAPLSSGIGRPMGLATLPGITGQAGVPAATPPAWAPQPAPWTSTAPQPFAVPQRKF